MDTEIFADYIRSDALPELRKRIIAQQRALTRARRFALEFHPDERSPEHVAAVYKAALAQARVDSFKESWLIVTGEAFA